MNICMYRITILFCYIVELSPVIADRGSCSFAMLCRRGWFEYSLSLCEDYMFNKLSSNSGLTHLWAEVVLLGVEGRHHGVLHLF